MLPREGMVSIQDGCVSSNNVMKNLTSQECSAAWVLVDYRHSHVDKPGYPSETSRDLGQGVREHRVFRAQESKENHGTESRLMAWKNTRTSSQNQTLPLQLPCGRKSLTIMSWQNPFRKCKTGARETALQLRVPVPTEDPG